MNHKKLRRLYREERLQVRFVAAASALTQRDAVLRRGLRAPSRCFTEPNGRKSTQDSAHRWKGLRSEGPAANRRERFERIQAAMRDARVNRESILNQEFDRKRCRTSTIDYSLTAS